MILDPTVHTRYVVMTQYNLSSKSSMCRDGITSSRSSICRYDIRSYRLYRSYRSHRSHRSYRSYRSHMHSFFRFNFTLLRHHISYILLSIPKSSLTYPRGGDIFFVDAGGTSEGEDFFFFRKINPPGGNSEKRWWWWWWGGG